MASTPDRPTLTAAVSLEPWDLSQRAHPATQDPDACAAHWQACLADAGALGLRAVAPGSYEVAVEDLVEPSALRAVWRVHAQTYFSPEDPLTPEQLWEWQQPLQGGLVLQQAGRPPLLPACCCCLGNLADWKTVLAAPPADWDMLWIGHPWVQVKAEGARLLIGPPTESSQPPSEAAYEVELEALTAAVGEAESALEAFAQRLVEPIAEWLRAQAFAVGPDAARRVARVAAGLEAARC
ncbi:MAG: hypothetical protein R3F62_10350 [Planctomycetota bacterium]